MKITAAVTEAQGAPFVLTELELGEIRDDELLVDISAAGVCHTDLICRDQWIPVPLPAVLGHEGAGVVRAVGSAVEKVAVGERVGLTFDSCGICPCCRRGKPSYCHHFFEHNFAAARPPTAPARSRAAGRRCTPISSASRASRRRPWRASATSSRSRATSRSRSRRRSAVASRPAPAPC